MSVYRRALSVLLLLAPAGLLTTPVAEAQPRSIRFHRLSAEEGLSQRSIHTLLQDRHGFLWAGTQDGLNRHDGFGFVVYKHDPQDPGSLAHNHVRTLLEDRRGDLWVGTEGGGVDRLARSSGTFVHHRHDPGDPATLSDDRVRVLLEDSTGVLWVGTEGGLDALDPATGRVRRHHHGPEGAAGMAGNAILSLQESATGELWVGTRDGLRRLDRGTGICEPYRPHPQAPPTLGGVAILSLHESAAGELWVGTRHGLYRLEPETGGSTRYSHHPDDPVSLGEETVRAILEDREGRLWLGTDGGLDLFEAGSGSFVHYRHDPADPASLADDHVISLYQDRGDVLWVGTLGGGLHRWSPLTWSFPHYRHAAEDPASLASNVVMAFSEDPEGGLWIGTHGGGLDRWGRDRGVFTHYRAEPGAPGSLADDRVMALLHDRGGVLWVGTFAGGLHRFDPATGGFRRWAHDPNRTSSLTADGITALFEDRGGTLWVGTFGGGLDRFDRRTETFTHLRHDPADPTSLASDRISCLAEDAAGSLWVGTLDGGLHLLDRRTGTFLRFRHHPDDAGGLPADAVYSLHVDGDGTLWVGTGGGGLSRLESWDRGSGQAVFRTWSEREGLPNSVVYGIRPDGSGRLWLSTNRGLARFDPRDESVKSYGLDNGLQGREFNLGAHFRSPGGELFFGGSNGFNAFYPERVRTNTHSPPVVLTRLLRYDIPMPLESPAEELTHLELTHEDHVVTFEFAALDFTAPESNRYTYRLAGASGGWVDVGNLRRVTFTNLSPGRYVFQVRAANGDSVWSDRQLALELRITPPPWLSVWAYALYALAAAAVITAYTLYQRRRLRREEAYSHRLEQEVETRTRELAESNRELQALNRRLAKVSVTDSLTGLKNRRYLLDHLGPDASLARRSFQDRSRRDARHRGSAGLFELLFLMIDLDRFKPINDLHGHSAGDRVLVQLGEILGRACRDSDVLVRWGGDEFLVVARQADRQRAQALAERIREAVAEHRFDLGEGRVETTTCSIGFAAFPFLSSDPDLLSWEQALAIADRALSLAKSAGKNTAVGIFATGTAPPEDFFRRIQTEPERLQAEGHLEIWTRGAGSVRQAVGG